MNSAFTLSASGTLPCLLKLPIATAVGKGASGIHSLSLALFWLASRVKTARPAEYGLRASALCQDAKTKTPAATDALEEEGVSTQNSGTGAERNSCLTGAGDTLPCGGGSLFASRRRAGAKPQPSNGSKVAISRQRSAFTVHSVP
jgi:hypothetical protein